MATVTVLEQAFMNTMNGSTTTVHEWTFLADSFNIAWSNGSGTPSYVEAFGTFTGLWGDLSDPYQGTITRVLINGGSTQLPPDLDITGLSFLALNTYIQGLYNSADVNSFLRDLLSGNDTVLGASGGDALLGFGG